MAIEVPPEPQRTLSHGTGCLEGEVIVSAQEAAQGDDEMLADVRAVLASFLPNERAQLVAACELIIREAG